MSAGDRGHDYCQTIAGGVDFLVMQQVSNFCKDVNQCNSQWSICEKRDEGKRVGIWKLIVYIDHILFSFDSQWNYLGVNDREPHEGMHA